MCDMCDATNTEYEDQVFKSIASCRNHPGQPLVILKDHRADLTPRELTHLLQFINAFYPGYRPRDTGMGSNQAHWHEHLIKRVP